MIKDEICKVENRIFLRGCKKLLRDDIMNTRSTISKICPIQSLISGWIGLRGIRKARILENKDRHYYGSYMVRCCTDRE
jgi:hypothetical protein